MMGVLNTVVLVLAADDCSGQMQVVLTWLRTRSASLFTTPIMNTSELYRDTQKGLSWFW